MKRLYKQKVNQLKTNPDKQFSKATFVKNRVWHLKLSPPASSTDSSNRCQNVTPIPSAQK